MYLLNDVYKLVVKALGWPSFYKALRKLAEYIGAIIWKKNRNRASSSINAGNNMVTGLKENYWNNQCELIIQD